MICAKCGATNPSESAYCGGCGSFLAPAPGPEAAVEGNQPVQPAASPSPADSVATLADASGDEMPTFHTVQPVIGQESAQPAIDELPTARGIPAQPTPAASEFLNFAPPAVPQVWPGTPATPASPAPGFSPVSGTLPVAQPGVSGALYPQQGQMAPGFPSGAQFPTVAPQPTPLPGYPQALPQPVYPQATPLPIYPQATPLPGYPPVQGQPSGEFPAGAFPLPGQQVPGAWGVYGAPGSIPTTPPAPQSTPSKLINPLPLWAFIGSIVLVVVVLAVLTFFSGTDSISSPLQVQPVQVHPGWAAGAQIAGIVALILGVLILIAFGVRSGLGLLAQTNPHRRKQMLSSLVLTLLLIAFGAVGLTAQAGIHNSQGRYLDAQHDWLNAIYEYQAAGQGAPSSEDIASTYVDWGKSLVSAGKYGDGIAKFDIVTSNYNQAPNGFAQAKSQAIQAYMNWGNQAAQAQKYSEATQHYDKLLAESYCDSSCQTQAGAADATAYDKLAEQRLHQTPPDYAGAVAAFNQLTTRFGSSPEGKSAHADYASALWGDAQQLLTTTCASALPLYQQLSSQFSDTPQGQEATTALSQPAPVKGHFTSNIPGGAEAPAVALMQGISAQTPTDQFYAILAKSPITNVKSDGTFTFKSIKQGSYYLVWGTVNQSKGTAIFISSQLYPASVGPLCGFNFGDINESFPLA